MTPNRRGHMASYIGRREFWPPSAVRRQRGRSWAVAAADDGRSADISGPPLPTITRRTRGPRGGNANRGRCPRLELATEVGLRNSVHATEGVVASLGSEVGHAFSSNSVRARNCPVCGGIWRHFVSRKVRFWAVVCTRNGGICRGAG